MRFFTVSTVIYLGFGTAQHESPPYVSSHLNHQRLQPRAHSPQSVSLHYCNEGDSCWPTPAEVAAFEAELDPDISRSLSWSGQPNPRTCSVPANSPNEQPLYGRYADGMKALYAMPTPLEAGRCLNNAEISLFRNTTCLTALRNNNLEGWQPAFAVWPTTAEHVQSAVRFALDHRLCIMVLGTGHDFMNRHSCDNGLLIRTTLLKDVDWDLSDSKVRIFVVPFHGHIVQQA